MNQEAWEERREPWRRRDDDARTEYEVDLARVLHSSSFRRLGAVTQVISGEGTLQRTRLTHSLEVQQIAEGIVQRFRLKKDLPEVLQTHIIDSSLIRTIALVHDMGHPPFGHAGEEALNCMMRDRGNGSSIGFEGNGQTIRILAKLEDFSEKAGANLTRRALLGALKYPVPMSKAMKKPIPGPKLTETGIPMVTHDLHAPPKCYMDTEEDVVKWLLEPLGVDQANRVVEQSAKSVDASIMDRSDDLAYSFADLQDAITLGLITRDELMEDVPRDIWAQYLEYCERRNADELFHEEISYDTVMSSLFGKSRDLQKQIGRLMGYGIAQTAIRERDGFFDPLYAHVAVIEDEALALVEAVKSSILERVIFSPRLQHGRLQGQMSLIKIFDVMRSEPRHHLPEKQYQKYLASGRDDRIICDWLAGSSEGFITKIHRRLFVEGGASVTDRI